MGRRERDGRRKGGGIGEEREQWETKGREERGKGDPQALLGEKITGTHRKRRSGKMKKKRLKGWLPFEDRGY